MSIEDAPVTSIDILLVIVAHKLKKKVLTQSIKDVIGGKTTLRNEIIGDLQQEFSSASEKGEGLPLEELVSALGTDSSGSLRKCTTGLVPRGIGGMILVDSIPLPSRHIWQRAGVLGATFRRRSPRIDSGASQMSRFRTQG